MALVFPLSPAIGQQFTGTNGIVYEWTSIGAWDKVNSVQTARSGPTASTSSARIPVGNTAERPSPSLVAGQFRYNNQIPQLEYSDGTTWLSVSVPLILPATLPQAQAGTLTSVYSSPQTAVPKDASGMTGAAYLPAGTTAQRPSPTAYTGQFRYNTTIPQLEYTDGTAWAAVVPPGSGVTSFNAGTTGFTPVAATSGAITIAGILNVANGGTGATTAAGGFNNLLPSQTGNAGRVLGTDGTTAGWVAAAGGTPAYDGVGSYGFLKRDAYAAGSPNIFPIRPGGTLTGGNLEWSGLGVPAGPPFTAAGTWRCQGDSTGFPTGPGTSQTVWVRVA